MLTSDSRRQEREGNVRVAVCQVRHWYFLSEIELSVFIRIYIYHLSKSFQLAKGHVIACAISVSCTLFHV